MIICLSFPGFPTPPKKKGFLLSTSCSGHFRQKKYLVSPFTFCFSSDIVYSLILPVLVFFYCFWARSDWEARTQLCENSPENFQFTSHWRFIAPTVPHQTSPSACICHLVLHIISSLMNTDRVGCGSIVVRGAWFLSNIMKAYAFKNFWFIFIYT